jgi:peptidylprolyl isomerase
VESTKSPAQDESTEEMQDAEESSDAESAGELEEPEADADQTEIEDAGSTFDIYGGLGEDDVLTTESGLQYLIVDEGTGTKAESGEVVSVHYTGYLTDGTVFDSSVERGVPFTFPLGQGRVIRGWDEGIALLNEGASARLIIPPDLAYGANGSGAIPPNSTLIFDVELVEILPPPPEAPAEIDAEDYTVTDSGLMFFDTELGSGPTAAESQVAYLHFTAWLDDGTSLGSTLEGGSPIPYVIGSGDLFPGFEEGILSMQVGGSRQIVYPPELAYGEAGTPGGEIPPNSTLIFEVQLVDVQ